MATSVARTVKNVVIGKGRDLHDTSIFHKVSLIALFAWVGLGADGLSSSCYGPEEAYKTLGSHTHLSLFVALGSMLTVLIICASYSQIIELFPSGGGGYLVASKLLSPKLGVVSGCALLIDYVLTITISVASGIDALFSMLPPHWQQWKLVAEVAGIGLLTIMNLRGVKESVVVLTPIFLLFVVTHAFAILYALGSHVGEVGQLVTQTTTDFKNSQSELGLFGAMLLILRAYSMGAGTYTGIEAVSNGLPILREPRVQTGKRTMRYMGFSLALTVGGLLLAYLLLHVSHEEGKTLNAVLFEKMTANWGGFGFTFVLVTLASEACLLLIAAQAGFLDGPRVLANMALDRWFPSRFSTLSDRLVNQNGIMLMAGAGLIVLLATGGSVDWLVVLYSINVFITFSLSQMGMVKHWWEVRGREKGWAKKLAINGIGLTLTGGILISLTIVKFHEGGWITLVVTALLVGLALLIRRHYDHTRRLLNRCDDLVRIAQKTGPHNDLSHTVPAVPDAQAKTAVILVNGFNGLGLHTLLNIQRLFGGLYKNYVFLCVGVVDAGNFKGADEIERLKQHCDQEAGLYVAFMQSQGYYAEGVTAIGIDPVAKIAEMAPDIVTKYPGSVFFGGQLVFPHDSFFTRLLHNSFVFAIQRRFYYQGFPFLILPIRV